MFVTSSTRTFMWIMDRPLSPLNRKQYTRKLISDSNVKKWKSWLDSWISINNFNVFREWLYMYLPMLYACPCVLRRIWTCNSCSRVSPSHRRNRGNSFGVSHGKVKVSSPKRTHCTKIGTLPGSLCNWGRKIYFESFEYSSRPNLLLH